MRQPPAIRSLHAGARLAERGAGDIEFSRRDAATAGQLDGSTLRGGLGLTVSYWTTLEAIRNWKQVAEHRIVQGLGREKWYRRYRVRVSRVERDYGWERPREP